MRRMRTMLFVLAAVGTALLIMLVIGLVVGTEDSTDGAPPPHRPTSGRTAP